MYHWQLNELEKNPIDIDESVIVKIIDITLKCKKMHFNGFNELLFYLYALQTKTENEKK
jgi:hypothetical protein